MPDAQSPAVIRQAFKPTSRATAGGESGAVPHLTAEARGQVRLRMDSEACIFHADVAPGVHPRWLSLMLDCVTMLGFEPIPLDECEAEILDDGWVRRHLVPIVPCDDAPLIIAPQVSA